MTLDVCPERRYRPANGRQRSVINVSVALATDSHSPSCKIATHAVEFCSAAHEASTRRSTSNTSGSECDPSHCVFYYLPSVQSLTLVSLARSPPRVGQPTLFVQTLGLDGVHTHCNEGHTPRRWFRLLSASAASVSLVTNAALLRGRQEVSHAAHAFAPKQCARTAQPLERRTEQFRVGVGVSRHVMGLCGRVNS